MFDLVLNTPYSFTIQCYSENLTELFFPALKPLPEIYGKAGFSVIIFPYME